MLVYNGEIYNDAELRWELSALRCRFRSLCDTEVVMQAYRQWGVDCVRRFRGMFTFGLYDFEQDRLLLVRDRFGIKPLFLTEVDGDLVFASSIAALLQHPRLSKSPNILAISHYLTTFRITLGRETLFAGVRQLLPGERLIAAGGETRIDRYWEYPDREDASLDDADAVGELEAGLRRSIGEHIEGDRPMMSQYGSLFSNLPGSSTSRRRALVLHHVNLEGLLSRLDSATMLAGLEARVPYTDHEVVERMLRLPEPCRIDIANQTSPRTSPPANCTPAAASVRNARCEHLRRSSFHRNSPGVRRPVSRRPSPPG